MFQAFYKAWNIISKMLTICIDGDGMSISQRFGFLETCYQRIALSSVIRIRDNLDGRIAAVSSVLPSLTTMIELQYFSTSSITRLIVVALLYVGMITQIISILIEP